LLNRSSHNSNRGIAFVEAAMWLSVTMPVAFLGAGLVGMVHDQSLLQGVPASVLREVEVPGGQWSPTNGTLATISFDTVRLAQSVQTLVAAAFQEASAGVLRADKISAKGCFWIFSVNKRTGSLETPISTGCSSQGPLAGAISLAEPLRREVQEGRGLLLGALGGSSAYGDRVALVGVGVAGEFPGAFTSDQPVQIVWGEVSYPRQEVGL
jgi:hypothetical protein